MERDEKFYCKIAGLVAAVVIPVAAITAIVIHIRGKLEEIEPPEIYPEELAKADQ